MDARSLRFSVTPLCLAAFLCWTPAVASAATDYFSDAQAYVEKGELRAAVIQLRNLLQDQPDHAEGRLLLGTLRLRQGDLAGAEKELFRARQLGIEPDRVLLPLAKAQLARERMAEVLYTLDPEALKSLENRREALALVGTAYLGLNQTEEARARFEQALGLGKSPLAHLGLARLALIEGNNSVAQEHLEVAAADPDTSAEGYLLIGAMAYSNKRYKAALDAYQAGLKNDPRHAKLRLAQAEALFGQGEIKAAATEIESILADHPNNPLALTLLARVQIAQKDFSQARSNAEAALKGASNHAPALFAAGVAHYGLGQLQQAKEYLSHLLTIVPESTPGRRLLGATLLRLGQGREALKYLESGGGGKDGDPRILALQAHAYALEGDMIKSRQLLERAVSVAPEDGTLQAHLALARLYAGDEDEAVTAFEAAERLGGPEYATVYRVLTLVHSGHSDRAHQELDRLARERGDRAIWHYLRGVVLREEGNTEASLAAFEAATRGQATFAPALLSAGDLAFKQGNMDAARAYYGRALDAVPEEPRALLGMAQLARTEHDADQALRWLKKARQAAPGWFEPVRLMAAFYQRQGALDKALAVVREYQLDEPEDRAAQSLLARLLIAAGRPASARVPLQRLVESNPEDIDHRFLLADTVASDHPEIAMGLIEEIITIEPDNAQAQAVRIKLLLAQNKATEARAALASLRQAHPESSLYMHLEGDLHFKLENWHEALVAYRAAWAHGSSTGTLAPLVEAAVRAGDLAAAEQVLKEHLSRMPEDVLNRITLANVLQLQNHPQLAIDQYQKVLEQAPTNIAALNNLAWIYAERDPQRALEYARRAYQLWPKSPAVGDTLGWLQVLHGDPEDGRRLLEQTLRSVPQDMQVRYHLAVALYRLGDKGRARHHLHRLLAQKGAESLAEYDAAQTLLKRLN